MTALGVTVIQLAELMDCNQPAPDIEASQAADRFSPLDNGYSDEPEASDRAVA